MAPQIFGWQHLVYLLINAIVIFFSLFLGKRYLKSEKSKTIFVKCVAFLLLIMIVWSRVSVVIYRRNSNWAYLLPETFCAFTSLAFSIAVLLGKKNNFSYHCFWYLGIGGGLITLAYPDFIGQDASFWYLPTITGLLHHSFLTYLCFALLVFGWFKPELKKSYIFAIGTMIYILIGYFEINVLHFSNAMCINKPLLSGTPIYGYFILGVGTALVILFNLILIVIQKLIDRNKQKVAKA